MNADLSPIITSLGPLFAVIVIGAVLKTLGILPAEIAPLIARMVMTLTLPALVFLSIRRAGASLLRPELLKIPLLAYLVIAACGGLAWATGRWLLHLDRPQMGALILAAMFGSTAFLGYPIVQALTLVGQLGPEGNIGHVLYSEVGTLVTLVTVGLMVGSLYGEGEKWSWRSLLAIPRAAPFIALMIGLLFYNDPLPPLITDTINLIGGTTSFLMMLYLGMSIVGTGFMAYWRPVLAAQTIKLVFAPVFSVLLVFLLGLRSSPDLSKVAVIDSSTPSILLCLAYAAQYKLDVRLATALVFASFLFSIVTMAAWLLFAIALQ